MSFIDRYLSYFIAVSMILGVSIGSIFPNFSNYISSLELTGINLPIAFLIWGMIIPMMLSINFNSIIKIKDRPQIINNNLDQSIVRVPFNKITPDKNHCSARSNS